MLVRSSCLRASREARPHAPSNAAETRSVVQAKVREFEEMGLQRAPNAAPAFKVNFTTSSKSKAAKRSTFEESHVLSLHSRTISGGSAESTWLSLFNQIKLTHSQLAFWAVRAAPVHPLRPSSLPFLSAHPVQMKTASVRISLVSEKQSPAATPKAGSSQQTT